MRWERTIVITGLLLILAMIFTGCSDDNGTNRQQDEGLRATIEKQINHLKHGKKIEIKVDAYDTIFVVPPYTSEKELLAAGVELDLAKDINMIMTTQENYHIMVVRGKQIERWAVLDLKYSTPNDTIVKVTYPDALKAERIERDIRPIQLSE